MSPRAALFVGVRGFLAEHLWAVLLALLAVDLALVVSNALSYPDFFRQPGADQKLIEVAALLLAYAGGGFAITRSLNAPHRRALATATAAGSLLGVLEMSNITIETSTTLRGGANLAITAPLILGPFVVWGVLGAWASRNSRSLSLGLLTALWSAMITISVGLIAGLALALADRSRLEKILITDPDFIRSRWNDVKAFVLANAFDNGSTHLLGGAIVGTTLGLIGGALALRRHRG